MDKFSGFKVFGDKAPAMKRDILAKIDYLSHLF